MKATVLCYSDQMQHKLHLHWNWLCDKHDEEIIMGFDDADFKPTLPPIRKPNG